MFNIVLHKQNSVVQSTGLVHLHCICPLAFLVNVRSHSIISHMHIFSTIKLNSSRFVLSRHFLVNKYFTFSYVVILYGIYYDHVAALCASCCLPGSATVDWTKWSKEYMCVCVCVCLILQDDIEDGICVALKTSFMWIHIFFFSLSFLMLHNTHIMPTQQNNCTIQYYLLRTIKIVKPIK